MGFSFVLLRVKRCSCFAFRCVVVTPESLGKIGVGGYGLAVRCYGFGVSGLVHSVRNDCTCLYSTSTACYHSCCHRQHPSVIRPLLPPNMPVASRGANRKRFQDGCGTSMNSSLQLNARISGCSGASHSWLQLPPCSFFAAYAARHLKVWPTVRFFE